MVVCSIYTTAGGKKQFPPQGSAPGHLPRGRRGARSLQRDGHVPHPDGGHLAHVQQVLELGGEADGAVATGGGGTGAATQTRRALEDYDLPEVRYFLDTFLDSFSLTLDELK